MKTLLFVMVSFITITSILSGLMMISNPDGKMLSLSLSLLDGTPFKNFLIPGIFLTALVGGTNLFALFFNIKRSSNRYNWAMAGGFVINGWIIAQMILIHAAHWLHFLYLATGILNILLAYQLKGKWAV